MANPKQASARQFQKRPAKSERMTADEALSEAMHIPNPEQPADRSASGKSRPSKSRRTPK